MTGSARAALIKSTAASSMSILAGFALVACSPLAGQPPLHEVSLSETYGICLRLPDGFRVHDRRPATGYDLAAVGRGAEDARVEISAGVSLPELRHAVASQPANQTGLAPLAATTVNGRRFVLYGGPMYVLFSGSESLLSDPVFAGRDTVVACDVPPRPDSVDVARWRQPLPATRVLACPSEIDDNQSLRSPRNWQARVERGQRALHFINVFLGPPAGRASVQPLEENGRYVWSLPAGEEVWVECLYRSSAIVLSRKLPAVDQCMLELPPPESYEPARKATCRLQDPLVAEERAR